MVLVAATLHGDGMVSTGWEAQELGSIPSMCFAASIQVWRQSWS